jgi:hypothetical protein
VKTAIWRGLEEPRMEIAHVESWERAHGTQIGVAYEVRWELDGPSLRLEHVGGRRVELELGDADFFDVLASPFFNSLPVMRDGLLEVRPAREYTMSFVRVPELTAEPSLQRYEPVGVRTVRYSSGSFEADIEFDANGLVTLYHGYLERIA